MVRDIDVDELIKLGVKPLESSAKRNKNNAVSKVQKRKALELKNKRKIKRVEKFLQSRDASKLPDPERWLPLRDRSTYRPKKKQQGAKQTQGGAMNKKSEQALDISKKGKPAANKKVKNKKKGRKSVSYTHLDVYKRQFIKYMKNLNVISHFFQVKNIRRSD